MKSQKLPQRLKDTKKLKIFVDCHCFDGKYQGSRTFIKGIYTSLSCSTEIDIYLGAYDIKKLQSEFPSVPAQNLIQYQFRNPMIRLGLEIPLILKKHQFDYAHFQYISPFIKYCKYIVTAHDVLYKDFKKAFPWYYRLIRNRLFERSFKKADIKTAPSEYSRQRLAFHYHISPDKIHLIPNGVSHTFFEGGEGREKAAAIIGAKYGLCKFILNVSRLEPRKNQVLLLEAFLDMQLYDQEISLVFIGERSLKDPVFHKKWQRLPGSIRKYIRHFSRVSAADLIRFYKAASVFVYPSIAEGFGIPPLEAGALKIPVLCADKTAMSDYIFFKENLFTLEDEKDFRKKLSGLLTGKSDQKKLEKISGIIGENYSWIKSSQKLWQCIREQECLML